MNYETWQAWAEILAEYLDEALECIDPESDEMDDKRRLLTMFDGWRLEQQGQTRLDLI